MTCKGRVAGGVVVLERTGLLPEGAEVKVQLVKQVRRGKRKLSLSEKLLRWAGTAKGLPSDFARNHDHYLHGAPKR
jgi:hypothetical protein